MGAATCFVGIDVSKATLDACLLGPDGRAGEATFGNDARGHAALIAWAARRAAAGGLHFCLEATGPYSEAPALALAAAGRPVSVVNPTRVKYAGLMRGRGHKTDPAFPPRAQAAADPPADCPPAPPAGQAPDGPARRPLTALLVGPTCPRPSSGRRGSAPPSDRLLRGVLP